MSLAVRLTASSSFDDRNAIARYCVHKNYKYTFEDRYGPVDVFTIKPNGIRVALKLIRSTCWTTQLTYPEENISVSRGKWKMFHEQVRDISCKNIHRAEEAYLVLLNTLYTRAAFISFSSILDDLALFEENVKDIGTIWNNQAQQTAYISQVPSPPQPIILVSIPTSYISGYINIPPEQKEAKA